MKRIISLGSGVLVVVSLLTMLATIGCKKRPEGEYVKVVVKTVRDKCSIETGHEVTRGILPMGVVIRTKRNTYEYFVDVSNLEPGLDFILLKGHYEYADYWLEESKPSKPYTPDTFTILYPWNGEDELRFLFTPYLFSFCDCETKCRLTEFNDEKYNLLGYTYEKIKSIVLRRDAGRIDFYPNVEFAEVYFSKDESRFPYSMCGEWFAEEVKNPDLLKGLCIRSSAEDTNNLEFLRTFENLTYLILDNTGINDSALSCLAQLSKLRALSLVGTAITDSGLFHLQGLTNLHTLRLDSTSITDQGLVYLKELPNLNYLSISKTHITDSGLVHLTGLSNLQYLMIYGTDVSDAGVEHIIKIKGLRTLGYGGTKITEAGLKRLLDVFPEWGKLDQNL